MSYVQPCPYCGGRISMGARFCSWCGENVREEGSA